MELGHWIDSSICDSFTLHSGSAAQSLPFQQRRRPRRPRLSRGQRAHRVPHIIINKSAGKTTSPVRHVPRSAPQHLAPRTPHTPTPKPEATDPTRAGRPAANVATHAPLFGSIGGCRLSCRAQEEPREGG
jgi:hypothetical protein